MPSRLVLNPQLPQSTLNVANAIQRVRAGDFKAGAEALDRLQSAVQQLQAAFREGARLKSLSVASADIQDLTVGGEEGPGQLLVLSGPPDYAPVGWDGTEDSGDAVDILTFNGDTITTDGPHRTLPGHIVKIEGNSSPYRNGWFNVLTTPTEDTYTVTNPGVANGTGGTSTVQFAGGWRKQFAIGETEPDGGILTAPLFTDPQGNVYIGERGSISLLDALQQVKGFLGVVKEAPLAAVASDNGSGKMRLAVTGHGYSAKDDVVFVPDTGDPVDAMVVTVVDANTVDTDAAAVAVAGNVYRYRGPFYGQSIQLGKPTAGDYPFRTFSDGSLRIGLSGDATIEIDAAGNLNVTDGSLVIDAPPLLIKINGADGVKVENVGSFYAQMNDLGLTVGSSTATYPRVRTTQSAVIAESGAANAHAAKLFTATGGQLQLFSALGNLLISGDGSTGAFACESLTVAGSAYTPFDSANYYTKTEVDTLLAGKANAAHSHSVAGVTSFDVGHSHTVAGTAS